MFDLTTLYPFIIMPLIMRLLWLCGGKCLPSICEYSVRITCPFSLATSAVLLGITFGGQKIINSPKQKHKSCNSRRGALFFSHTRKKLFTAQTHTLLALDVGRLAASIAQHIQVQKNTAYVRFAPIIIVSFQAYHTLYGS
jgi:hypothetical protein